MDLRPSSGSSPISLDNGTDDATKLQNLNTLGAILLGIFTIISFVGNIFLLSTVYSSYQLRQSVFNYFLTNVSLVNLVDASINLVLSVLYVSTGQWQLGRIACTLNSFFEQLVLIETLSSVMLLTVDRAIALQSISRYENRLTPIRCSVIVGGVWAIGGIVSLPILIGSWSEPNRYRYFCCNYANNPLGYPVSILLLCFAIPLFIVLLSLGAIFLRAHEERLRRRAMLPERLADYTDFIIDTRRVQKTMELSKYSVIVFVIYFLLQGPYVILNFIGQVRNSLDLIQKYGGRGAAIDGDAETAITWLKTLFPVSFPFFTFCLSRDIWRKFKDLLCCRRTNVIAANAFSSSLEAAEVAAMAAAATGHCGSAGNNGHCGGHGKEMANVVTIVPTSAGIHQIRPGNDRCEYADVPQMAEALARGRDSQLPIHIHPTGSRTSDYDSEESDVPVDLQGSAKGRKSSGCNTSQCDRSANCDDQAGPILDGDDPREPSTSADTGPILLSPSAVDAVSGCKFSEEIDKHMQRIGAHPAESPKANSASTDWPTIFRPKSASADPARSRKRRVVNPGAVPSPEKPIAQGRRHKGPAAVQDKAEKTRIPLDDKLKSILQDKLENGTSQEQVDEGNAACEVMRHNHLPPLNVDPQTPHSLRKRRKDNDTRRDKEENLRAANEAGDPGRSVITGQLHRVDPQKSTAVNNQLIADAAGRSKENKTAEQSDVGGKGPLPAAPKEN